MQRLLLVTLFSLSIFAHPTLQEAPKCDSSACLPSNGCRCSSTENPITDADNPAPQLIAITVSESIVQTLYDKYLKPLFFDRKNKDGSPVGITYYVNHEFTDYALVQDLYVRGYEIGVHSITKEPNQTYWRQATKDLLVQEFSGQKEIISTFANIDPDVITGVRTPQLQIEGDVSFEAYAEAELSYDNSWPALSSEHLLPYTLDYASTQQCTASETCPKESHAGFWIAPITDIKGVNDTECNSLATCLVKGSADDIAKWLTEQVDLVVNYNRAPITLRLDSYWFTYTENSYNGFIKFLDAMNSRDEVFLVTVQDILAWVKNPVGVNEYTVPDHSDREADCFNVNCHLKRDSDGEERYMKSCVPCPDVYPWLGNPQGQNK